MRLFEAEAILLDVVDLHEADRIVVFLTREFGQKRGAARGARRRYSRFAGELQPLAKVRARWFEKEGRDLARISQVELLRPAKRLNADLEGILTGACLAEHMKVFVPENEASELPFRLLDSTLAALEEGVDRALAARYFEAWALRLAGIFPEPRECPRCGRPLEEAALAVDDASLVCRECAGPGALAVSADALAFFRRIGRENLPRVAAHPPSAGVLSEIEAICGRIRRHFLGHELASYDVLRRTLGGLPPEGPRAERGRSSGTGAE